MLIYYKQLEVAILLARYLTNQNLPVTKNILIYDVMSNFPSIKNQYANKFKHVHTELDVANIQIR